MLLSGATIVVFCLTLLVIWVINTIVRRRRMPPGPFPLPVFGNYFHIWLGYGNADDFWRGLHRNYGKLTHWSVGSIDFVRIADLKILQEAFVKKAASFSNRPNHIFPHRRFVSKRFGTGIVFSDGAEWKNLRRLSLTAMRDLGVGKKSLEEKIGAELDVVLECLSKVEGRPYYSKPLMVKATSNVICNIVFGDRFDYQDPRFVYLLDKVTLLFDAGSVATFQRIFTVFPFLLTIFSALSKYTVASRGASVFGAVGEHVRELTEDHKKTFDPNNIRDFIDLALDCKENNRKCSEASVRWTVVDFFLAGSDTTANAMYWALLYMAARPDIQTRCQQEIDSVVGKSRAVTLEDKTKLKYVEATILEVLRMGIIAPMSVPHCTSEDVELAGYLIPKDTVVLASIATLCRDPDLWTSPDLFDPGRFLDSENNIINKELLVNFSIGARSCIGELLAKMELNLFFPGILQKFTVQPRPGQHVDLEPFRGVTIQGKKQDLVFVKRD